MQSRCRAVVAFSWGTFATCLVRRHVANVPHDRSAFGQRWRPSGRAGLASHGQGDTVDPITPASRIEWRNARSKVTRPTTSTARSTDPRKTGTTSPTRKRGMRAAWDYKPDAPARDACGRFPRWRVGLVVPRLRIGLLIPWSPSTRDHSSMTEAVTSTTSHPTQNEKLQREQRHADRIGISRPLHIGHAGELLLGAAVLEGAGSRSDCSRCICPLLNT
jgi:hypothetical protein